MKEKRKVLPLSASTKNLKVFVNDERWFAKLLEIKDAKQGDQWVHMIISNKDNSITQDYLVGRRGMTHAWWGLKENKNRSQSILSQIDNEKWDTKKLTIFFKENEEWIGIYLTHPTKGKTLSIRVEHESMKDAFYSLLPFINMGEAIIDNAKGFIDNLL